MTRETLKFKNVLFGHVGFVGQKFSQEFLKLVVAYNVQRIQAISKLCSNVFSETKVDVSGLGNSLKSQHMTFFSNFNFRTSSKILLGRNNHSYRRISICLFGTFFKKQKRLLFFNDTKCLIKNPKILFPRTFHDFLG